MTDYDVLVQAVTNLVNEIEETSFDGLSYEDWCGEKNLDAIKQLIGWSKPELKPVVTIGMQPKWWIDTNGKLINNPDYIEPEPTEPEPEGEPKEGTCKFNMLTGESQAYISGQWIDMKPGDSITFTRKPKFFDVCTTNKLEKDFTIYHQLGCLPYLIFGRADGYGWFGWLRNSPNTDVIINGTTFTNLKIKEINDNHFVVDTDIFTGNSYYYCFSEDGFVEIENYFQKIEDGK